MSKPCVGYGPAVRKVDCLESLERGKVPKSFIVYFPHVSQIECTESDGALDDFERFVRLGPDGYATEVKGSQTRNLDQGFKLGFFEWRRRPEIGIEHGFAERASRGLGDGEMNGDRTVRAFCKLGPCLTEGIQSVLGVDL